MYVCMYVCINKNIQLIGGVKEENDIYISIKEERNNCQNKSTTHLPFNLPHPILQSLSLLSLKT